MEAKKYAPIAVFVYKRLEKTICVLNSLQRCEGAQQSDLFIFSDGWKNEEEKQMILSVRKYIHDYASNGTFHSIKIFEQEKNIGLANSVICGITKVFQQNTNVIVVEDDLVVAPNFLKYMNEGLSFYKSDNTIGTITGYTPPLKELDGYKNDIYLSRCGSSWGWATWKDIWDRVDWEVRDYEKFKKNVIARRKFEKIHRRINRMLDKQMSGLIDSWSVRFDYFLWKQGLFTVCPRCTLVFNDGFGNDATHTKSDKHSLIYNGKHKFDDYVPQFEYVRYDSYIGFLNAVYGHENISIKMEKAVRKVIHGLRQFVDPKQE